MLPRTPGILSWLFPEVIFRKKTGDAKVLYLTFDDGPTETGTEEILRVLKNFEAGATFFLVGKNAETYPEIVEKIKREGHSLGSHSYSHVNARKTEKKYYLTDVRKGMACVPSPYFRPPYGKITLSLYRTLKTEARIVMWDVIAEEFEPGYSWEKCLSKLKKQTRNGSVIVLHDSDKTREKVLRILPAFLAHFTAMGYRFKAL
jgi:peptidoglycan/xylan/chitin deacetylase (PgdA/CDA1 family)